jgi:hypothetical protein
VGGGGGGLKRVLGLLNHQIYFVNKSSDWSGGPHMRLLGTELQLLHVGCFSLVLAINTSFGCYFGDHFVLLEGLQSEGVIRQSIISHCQVETVLPCV